MNFNEWVKDDKKKILISNSNNFSNKVIKNYCIDFNTFINNIKPVTILDLLEKLFISKMAFENKNFIIINDSISVTIIEYLIRKEAMNSDLIYGFIPKTSIGGKTQAEVYKAMMQVKLGNVIKENERYLSLNKLIYDYDEFLEKNNYYDYYKLLDFGINYIYNHTKEELINDLGFGSNLKIGIFDNVKLTYLEALFLNLLEKNFNIEIEKINYIYEENKINNKFVKCYGLYNEVDFVVDEIINKNLNPSDINIYYTDIAYENFIRAILERRGIQFRFNKAQAVRTNIIQLFKDIISFYKNDYKYEDLYNVIKNPIFTFDKIIEKLNLDSADYNKPLNSFFDITNGNICNDKNRYIEYIKNYDNDNIRNDLFVKHFLLDLINVTDTDEIDELYINIYELIKKYTYVNNEYVSLKDKLDDLVIIFKIMSLINDGIENNLDYILSHLDNLTYSEKEDDLAINVINLNNYDVLDRKYNFILGLSSSQIKKKEVESAIFSDKDYLEMLDNNYYFKLAKNINNEFSDVLNKTFKSIYDANIYFEYSCFDTVDFKPMAPSIFYLDKKKDNEEIYYSYKVDSNNYIIDKKKIKEYVSSYRKAKDEHKANTNNLKFVDVSDKTLDLNIVVDEVVVDESLETKKADIWSMSATGLGSLIKCPMCYSYQYLKKIPNLSFRIPKSYAWLDSLAKGNLFHHTLENYSDVVFKNDLPFDENEFNEAYDKAILEAVKEIPYPNEKIYEKEYRKNKDIAYKYIKNLHKFYDENASIGKIYKNIGNELRFGIKEDIKSIIKDNYSIEINNKKYETAYELNLNGSIDRLDGYLDGDTLHFLIIDYKTSTKKNLGDEIVSYTKNQHYIYALATFDYFEQNKDKLEKIFNHEIKDCVIDDMEYHLPFSNDILSWSNGFGKRGFDKFIPSSKEDIILPSKMKEALGIVSLFRDGVNIDILYDELKKYYDKYNVKNPNEYSNYKHICRYEIDCYVEEDLDEDTGRE